jgi:hypothetical protein
LSSMSTISMLPSLPLTWQRSSGECCRCRNVAAAAVAAVYVVGEVVVVSVAVVVVDVEIWPIGFFSLRFLRLYSSQRVHPCCPLIVLQHNKQQKRIDEYIIKL